MDTHLNDNTLRMRLMRIVPRIEITLDYCVRKVRKAIIYENGQQYDILDYLGKNKNLDKTLEYDTRLKTAFSNMTIGNFYRN